MEIIKLYQENGEIKEAKVNLKKTDYEKKENLWVCRKEDCGEYNEIENEEVCGACKLANKHWDEEITEKSLRPKFDIKLIKWQISDIDELGCDDLYKFSYLYSTLNDDNQDDYFNPRNNKNKIEFEPEFNNIDVEYFDYGIWFHHQNIFTDFIKKVKNKQTKFKLHKKNSNYMYSFVCMIYEYILKNIFKYQYKKYNKIDKELVREDGFRRGRFSDDTFILLNEYDKNNLLPNVDVWDIDDIGYKSYCRPSQHTRLSDYIPDHYSYVPKDFKEYEVDLLVFDEASIPVANYPIEFTYYEILD